MKPGISILALLLFVNVLFGQNQKIKISDRLELIRLSPETYMHISEGSNGMLTTRNGECIIVSTPPTDEATTQLINWVTDSLKAKITGVIIDSWHPDNMEGLDVFQSLKIKSYACELTRTIAARKGLPVPEIGFSESLELKVGNKKIVLNYFGPAHTSDGSVAWIPEEKILFGNNGVRNLNGWIGNVGDADLQNWSATIEKVKHKYGSAKVVIPGHGPCGGPELLDYTISLYQPVSWGKILRDHNVEPQPVFENHGKIFLAAHTDSVAGDQHQLTDALVFIDKDSQYIVIQAPAIQYNAKTNSIRSNFGRIKFIDKATGPAKPEADGYYNTLMIDFRDDAVGMTIILKKLIQ